MRNAPFPSGVLAAAEATEHGIVNPATPAEPRAQGASEAALTLRGVCPVSFTRRITSTQGGARPMLRPRPYKRPSDPPATFFRFPVPLSPLLWFDVAASWLSRCRATHRPLGSA
jgi:hypothetical protein